MLWVRNALRAHNMPSWTPVFIIADETLAKLYIIEQY